MNWIDLNSTEKLAEATAESTTRPVLLFKHSTTCSISNTVLNRLERNWNKEELVGTTVYLLDLLSHRNISHEISRQFNVQHESPQVLLIQNEKSVYVCSHFDINYSSIQKEIEKLKKS